MKLYSWFVLTAVLLSACAAPVTGTPIQPVDATFIPTVAPATNSVPTASAAATQADDLFSVNNIVLSEPVCDGTLTPVQTEGPYYTPNTPERNSLLESDITGTRLLVVGYVLNQNCEPLQNTWIDFWQANANGEYDNSGYTLRGHQFTDSQGRYFLETIVPGLYESRPIEHIHVKLRSSSGIELTTQLYFPQQPIPGLTVLLEEREGYLIAYFNFVLAD